jgi:hypothetical protein
VADTVQYIVTDTIGAADEHVADGKYVVSMGCGSSAEAMALYGDMVTPKTSDKKTVHRGVGVEMRWVIFFFGMEDLFTKDSRAQLRAVSSFPQTVGCYWLSWRLN